MDTPVSARMKLARASVADRATEAERDALRANLATANADSALRRVFEGVPTIGDVAAAHLIGLILSQAGVNYEVGRGIEGVVRAAVVAAQAARAEAENGGSSK